MHPDKKRISRIRQKREEVVEGLPEDVPGQRLEKVWF